MINKLLAKIRQRRKNKLYRQITKLALENVRKLHTSKFTIHVRNPEDKDALAWDIIIDANIVSPNCAVRDWEEAKKKDENGDL